MTEQEYREAVYAEAKEVKTPEALAEFIAKRYAETLDYGTIVYACSATMQAAFNVMNAHPQFGGITGFQASCLMWEMVKKFGMFSEGPLRIQDFDNLRFPQYDDRFRVTLSPESAAELQERAKKAIAGGPDGFMSPNVRARQEAISRGEFPAFVTVEATR